MKYLYRILPFLFCFALTVSGIISFSPAYASDAEPLPPVSDPDDGEEDGDALVSTGMADTTAQLGRALIDGIWSLFGIQVPGFDFSFGQFWVGVFLASVSILVIRMIFGFGGSGSDGVSSRTSSTSNPKISKERRNDEF